MPTKDNKKESTANRRRAPARRARRSPPSEEEIRLRAYQLFEARGGESGHEQEDWERAERELLNGD
jgi:hypothetical protein